MSPPHRPWLDELFPLFFANLEDSIPSVRQGAAAALTSVTKAYGETMGWTSTYSLDYMQGHRRHHQVDAASS